MNLNFFGLDLIFEPNSTPELLLDFSQFPEPVLVHASPESKLLISLYHIPFWDKGEEKMTQNFFFKIKNLMGLIFQIKSYTYIIN